MGHQIDLKGPSTDSAFGFSIGQESARRPIQVEGAENFFLVPSDQWETLDLENLNAAPRRWDVKQHFAHPNDLGRYIKDHVSKHPGTRIFACKIGHVFTAVLDYETEDGDPLWGKHVGTMRCAPSREWSEWAQIDGKLMSQELFADFIDDHIDHIVEPEAARLHELVLRLEQTTTVNFKQAVNLTSGMVEVHYSETEDSSASKSVKLPSEIKLALRPFEFSSAYAVRAKLRYRIRERVLTFAVLLRRPDLVIEDAWHDAVKAVENASGIEPYVTTG